MTFQPVDLVELVVKEFTLTGCSAKINQSRRRETELESNQMGPNKDTHTHTHTHKGGFTFLTIVPIHKHFHNVMQ